MRTVAIIDDEPVQRGVLRGLLIEAGFRVAGEGASAEEAIRICAEQRPDAVLMDIAMSGPGGDGLDAARAIMEQCPLPIVILTGFCDNESLRRAVSAGVMGWLSKPVRLEELAPAIELASARFVEARAVMDENAALKESVEARKVIERARGLLMKKDGLTEAEAYGRIRRLSMDRRKSMKEVSEFIISLMGG